VILVFQEFAPPSSVSGLIFAFAGRRGRGTSSPPQFGHLRFRIVSAQEAQNVHSNEQMRASVESGGNSTLQRSQFDRS